VLRAGIIHLQRLQRARLAMDESRLSAGDAAKTIRPPLFYRRVAGFNRALGLWSSTGISAAISGLADAERGCKRTGYPDQILCRNAILVEARRAAAARSARG
jgi:DNA polymerase III subunit delta